jgi:Mg2+ and Co2+ transporter CorA
MSKQTDDAIHKALQPFQRRITMLLAEIDQKNQIIEELQDRINAHENFNMNRIVDESRQ